jgi:hypothetical protein
MHNDMLTDLIRKTKYFLDKKGLSRTVQNKCYLKNLNFCVMCLMCILLWGQVFNLALIHFLSLLICSVFTTLSAVISLKSHILSIWVLMWYKLSLTHYTEFCALNESLQHHRHHHHHFTTVVILSVRSEPVKWVFIKVHCCLLSSVTVISSVYNTYLISSHFSWVHSIDHDILYSSALSENLLSVIADFWVSIYDTEQFTLIKSIQVKAYELISLNISSL